MLSLSITSFIISAVLLIISGIFLVKSLDKIAKFLHISEFSAAFLIIAFATSLPELTVGIFSAINGNPELSLGNLLGSNLIDITLLIGIFVLIGKEIDFKKEKIEWDLWTMIIGIWRC
jgi:cation:H+ antiporter